MKILMTRLAASSRRLKDREQRCLPAVMLLWRVNHLWLHMITSTQSPGSQKTASSRRLKDREQRCLPAVMLLWRVNRLWLHMITSTQSPGSQKKDQVKHLESEIECATAVEIGPESTNDLYHRQFKVSQCQSVSEHSPEYDDTDEIIRLCQQLEEEQWPSSLDDKGFLSNEVIIHPYSYSSPGSQGSSDKEARQGCSSELSLPLRSDTSMDRIPINCRESVMMKQVRWASPAVSYKSMKSDRSMDHPFNFKRELTTTPDSGVGASPAPSCLSMRSDWSMGQPGNFKIELTTPLSTPDLGVGASPAPSCLSMRSDWSMGRPGNFRECLNSMIKPSSTPGDVACDVCSSSLKLRAVKTCVTCSASYCENHVRQHYTIPALQKHTLVQVNEDTRLSQWERNSGRMEDIKEGTIPPPSTSSDSTLSRPYMVSSQRTQDRKRREEELVSNVPSSTLPLFPSSTLSTSLNMSSLSCTQVPHLPKKRRKEADIGESDIPYFAPQEVIAPNMHLSVATVPPMLHSSSTSQQSSLDSPEEIMSCDTACDFSTTDHPVTETLSSVHHSLELQYETDINYSRIEESISLPRSHSLPSMRHIPCVENKAGFRAKRSHSLNDVTLLYKTQKCTPDIIVVDNKESYRFHCTQAGLFQCSVTGLVFKMETDRGVTYRTVPWDRRLLAQCGKRPGGPLFDMTGPQDSVTQLHFPHCEILSMGGGKSLYVLHVKDDDSIELIHPDVITETHVIINVNGFCRYGVVNDVQSTQPMWANVLLFYTPPIDDDDDDPKSTLKVLLLPRNVVLDEVRNKRRKQCGEEIYIEKPPCKLIPNQDYTLSVSPEDDSIIIEPDRAIFEVDESSYHNYISTFEVILEGRFKDSLRDSNPSICAWKGYVDLSSPAIRSQQVQCALSQKAKDRLFSVRSSFIESVSNPVLNSVLDKLFEKGVIIKEEYDEACVNKVKHEKARCVINTVRNKGTDASSIMIFILCETDEFLSKHLGLM